MSETKRHAKFSASGSERWLNCPGSIALAEKAPPQVESKYALEGTEAHTCLEFIMKNNGTASAIANVARRFPRSMVDHALATYAQIKTLAPKGNDILCETEVRLDFVEPGMFGTVDAAIAILFGTLYVIDYKYGAGRLVNAEENTQMIYYGLGIAHRFHFNFDDVCLVIAQPRIIHKDGFFRSWRMEVPALRSWTEKFKAGVEACKDPFAPLNPGRWCFFCPAKDICPAVEDAKYDEAQADFNDEP